MTPRVQALCDWLAFAFYFFLAYVLYRAMRHFPHFTEEYGDLVAMVAWLPIFGATMWFKSIIEDWILRDPGR